MNKENRSAAGQRRSAIAERRRIREEWRELKGRESQPAEREKNILTMKQTNIKTSAPSMDRHRKHSTRNTQQIENILCGVVALVEVGAESRALPLRAALTALGATVLPKWSPLVTHLVWSQGGCRSTRARARALASRLVSPLWVEACAAASRRLPERAFPAAARPSDLPSPKTLQQLLKRAEMENIPLADLLSDSTEEQKQFRLRISSETERDSTTDASRDVSRDTSDDTLDDTGVKEKEKHQRPLPTHSKPETPAKTRRKLFTQREADETDVDSDDDTPLPVVEKPAYVPAGTKTKKTKMAATQNDRRRLAHAERVAKMIVTGYTPAVRKRPRDDRPRIVLTGMCRTERRLVSEAVRRLGGRLQRAVNKRTTHVLVGTFVHDEDYNRTYAAGVPPLPSTGIPPADPSRHTLSGVCGAARGCRVLYAQWALHSKDDGRWRHHYGYEVHHYKKLAQKARLERVAWGKRGSEYAYDVFCGMRVCVSHTLVHPDDAVTLLKLCGANVLHNKENLIRPKPLTQNVQTQNGAQTQASVLTQNGGLKASQYYVTSRPDCDYDVKIGLQEGDVMPKWVFDSVVAARMRNTRRYLVEDTVFEEMEKLGC